MRKRLLFAFSALLGTMLLSMGCEEGKQPSGEKADSTKSEEKETKTVQLTPIRPTTATLFIDASASMRGYLDSGASEFPGVISAFENYADMTELWLYGKEKIGKTTKAKDIVSYPKNEFDEMLSKRSLPWAQESNLIAMINEMVNGKGDISILVTDGILSGSDKQIRESPNRGYNIQQRETMIHELFKILQRKNKCALIVRYMSKFTGTYSCYDNSAVELKEQGRPFFVIVLGKWESLKYLETSLKEQQVDKSSLATKYENIYMIGDQLDKVDRVRFDVGNEENSDGKRYIPYEYADSKINFEISTNDLPDYMQTQAYWNQNFSIETTTRNQINEKAKSVKVDESLKKVHLAIAADQLDGGEDDFELTFSLKFKQPDWIVNHSSDDDKNIKNEEQITKTFNLKYLVAGMEALNNAKGYVFKKSVKYTGRNNIN